MNEFGEYTVRVPLPEPKATDEFTTLGAAAPLVEVSVEHPIETAVEKAIDAPALRRIEQRMDNAITAILLLQRRIESMDAILARLVCR